MKKDTRSPYIINSISELHRLLQLSKPENPLVSLINMADITCDFNETFTSVVYNFYSICIKEDFKGKIKYGQNNYDFDEGVMTFFAPGQVISNVATDSIATKGQWLVIHPDLIRNYALSKTIKDHGYFSYAVNEALHLSEKEEAMVYSIFQNIAQEYRSNIDGFSQDVIVSHIELLLNYSNRFYNRQFITRKNAGSDLLTNVETLLSEYFDSDKVKEIGRPTVQYIAEQLMVSPGYLSDMLRTLTGQNAQQHIHNSLIDKAKNILSTTSLTVSEIAYQLGFEYPQSFNKLFKNKTNISPLAFRQSFN